MNAARLTLGNAPRAFLQFLVLNMALANLTHATDLSYALVDTNQRHTFDTQTYIEFPEPGDTFEGQDAQFSGNPPHYQDNEDGTISDLVTGLMWTRDPGKERVNFGEALQAADSCRVGGYGDWRLPNIKELYSLIQFSGVDPDPQDSDTSILIPFIDQSVFNFQYGDPSQGQRIIDAQFVSSTEYVSTTMRGDKTVFGVNFADGRIKGYPQVSRRSDGHFYALYVRGNAEYGVNQFKDTGDGTILDEATGLTWMKADSGHGMNWEEALAYAESMEFAGHTDWRLPTAKELQSIVDYTRSPDTTNSAAIDAIFWATEIKNEAGEKDFGWYWTSTTHKSSRNMNAAVYLCFGRSGGFIQDRRTGNYRLLDVHGAGAQRSDPKQGDASRYPHGRGPQGDVVRIDNLVRLVRGGKVERVESGPELPVLAQQQPRQRSDGSGRPTTFGGGQRQSPGQTPGENRFLNRFDTNGDNQVTRSEFSGSSERFEELDADGDGIIDDAEALNARPPRGQAQRRPRPR